MVKFQEEKKREGKSRSRVVSSRFVGTRARGRGKCKKKKKEKTVAPRTAQRNS